MLSLSLSDGSVINCSFVRMGRDYNISVYGGDVPHAGCVVLSCPRPSLSGDGISATSSVINCLGHKDEIIARRIAESVSIACSCTVICACGIHIDNISPLLIREIELCCAKITGYILSE